MNKSQARLLSVLLLLAAILLGAAVVQAQAVTVRVKTVEVASGQVAEVPITVEGSPGIAAMHLELTYDPNILVVESVEAGSLMVGNSLAAFNTDEPGRVVISLAAAENVTGDGPLAVVHFQVNGEVGQISALDLEYPEAWDESGFDLVVNTESGEFTVGSSGLSLLILALLGLLAVLLVALVVLIARRRRPKQPAAAAYPAQPQQFQAPAPQQPQAEGERTQGPKFCSNCGQGLEPGKQFCIHCGHPVGG